MASTRIRLLSRRQTRVEGYPTLVRPGLRQRRLASAVPLLLMVAWWCGSGVSSLQADTIFLKDGTQILDCQVTSETETHIYIRTPAGDMAVPRTEIYRLQRVKTVYDTYKEQLAALREGDVNGLYRLAQWCRKITGLRKESDECLAKVIELSENHAGARRLLGHLKSGDKWIVPTPLSLRLQVHGADAGEFSTQLDLFLKSRKDVRLAGAAESKPDAPVTLDDCKLEVNVVVSRRAGARLYGKTMGRATFGATVQLRARSPWLGSSRVRTAVDGQIPGNGADTSLGVKNALHRGSDSLHKFFDQLRDARAKKLALELRKKAREKKTASK